MPLHLPYYDYFDDYDYHFACGRSDAPCDAGSCVGWREEALLEEGLT
jgi:hypothetical protein